MRWFHMRAFLGVALLYRAVATEPPATEPTCASNEPTLWWDGQFVVSGIDRLRKGDAVGEPDVVIPWKNHDKWAWTAWHRFSMFHEGTEKDTHVFAPGYADPLECHKDLANLVIADPTNETTTVESAFGNHNVHVNSATRQSKSLVSNRAIVRGDPVFTTCRHPDLSSAVLLAGLPEYRQHDLRGVSVCIDAIKAAPSSIPNAGMGAYSKVKVLKGHIVSVAGLLHMSRSELHNKTSNEFELILNYAFGHPQTHLLFLPVARGVNYINHASEGYEANVKMTWSLEQGSPPIESRFGQEPSHVMFSRSETPQHFARYEALRDIAVGEELLLDYGMDWEAAWRDFVEDCGGRAQVATCRSGKPFRHAIGVPYGFYPQAWLDREVQAVKARYTWDLPPLQPGEVKQMTVLETGANPMSFGLRVGLPANFSKKMLEYADRICITDIMRKYITEGEPLKIGGQERTRINGGAWWIKRFFSEWQSNMHYITPDDERSNTDFLSALAEAGFDQVLKGLGEHFGLDGIVCYYASFIAVSHCSGSYPHVDAEATNGKAFNMIFPLLQANESTPELMLGEDRFGPMVVPYRYEPEAAIVLGDDAVHQTAPSDYRGTNQMRMVISVYFADINKENRWRVFWDKSMDPPYPRHRVRMQYLMRNAGRDWKAGTDNQLPVRDQSYA